MWSTALSGSSPRPRGNLPFQARYFSSRPKPSLGRAALVAQQLQLVIGQREVLE
jgi:hypothetical protein